MIKAGIIGASGYAGVELLRILKGHPYVTVSKLASVSFEGSAVSEMYPSLYGIYDDTLTSPDDVINDSDVVFAAVPHGVSEEYAKKCSELDKVFIDLGADFRLVDEAIYDKWYGGKFKDPSLHKNAVYGLPEIYREDIKKARIIANPGCYPTSAALGLYPAVSEGLIKKEGIIIDAKSGVTGAGRKTTQDSHYPELNEAFHPYKIGAHRHTPEIEQILSNMAKDKISVTFTPHLLPINRGIVSTIYAKSEAPFEKICETYKKVYEKETFVKVLPVGKTADLKNVRLSNYCHVSLHEHKHTGMVIIVSAIDNMVKGASGQAVQNMNLIMGLSETDGLLSPPPAF